MPAAPFYPTFRLTVFAPRSVDATEMTILTPAAGAPHADQFIVTSRQGIAGTKPYLDLPMARTGTIDPLNKTTTVGTVRLKIVDSRTAAGGSNASRWVTAFLGDGNGGNILVGRKVVVDQSWDLGVTWDAIPAYSGRISDTDISDGRLWVGLTIRDPSKDLDVDIFAGAPAAAVNGYATMAQIAPLGLLTPYGGFPQTTPLRGTTQAPAPGTKPPFKIVVDRSNGDPVRTLITQALMDVQRKTIMRTDKAADSNSAPRPKLYLRPAGGGAYTVYDVDWFTPTSTSLTEIFARPTQDAGAAAPPAAGTSVDFYIADPLAAPTARLPLLINDVNPVLYLQHLCAGYFGKLDAAGNPLRAVSIDVSALTGNYLPYRKPVIQTSKLNAEIEEVCKTYHWAYSVNGAGTVVVVDLRRSSTIAPAANLTDADLHDATTPPKWEQNTDNALTAVLGTFYTERQISVGELPKPFESLPAGDAYGDAPDVPCIRIADGDPITVAIPITGPRAGDVKYNSFKIDAKGLRVRIGATQNSAETLNGSSRSDQIQGHFIGYAGEITGPYGLGPSFIDIVGMRSSANVAAIAPGKYATLQFSSVPDPATNLRGGIRLGLCLSRTEDGPMVKLRFIDAGANSVALVPTVGALAASGGTTNIGIDVPITLNAAGEPARVSYLATDTTVGVRPADNDVRWTNAPLATVAGTVSITDVPHGSRIWIRARTEPTAGKGFKLPSAWVYPSAGLGYALSTALNPPTAIAVSAGLAADQVLSWTNGETWPETEVLLVLGVAPAAWLDSMVIDTVAIGSVQYPIGHFLTNGTQYTVGVRHRDLTGGASAVDQLTFVAGALLTLNAPTNPDAFSRPMPGFIRRTALYGLAVIAREFPSYVSYEQAIETGIGTGVYGAYVPVGLVESVAGTWTQWAGIAPLDNLRRKLRAQHVRDNANPSAYCAEVVVSPWIPDPLATYPISPPTATIRLISRTRTVEIIQLEGAIGANDSGPLQWAMAFGKDAFSAFSGAALPTQLTVNRPAFYAEPVVLRVLQGDGQTKDFSYTVAARYDDSSTGEPQAVMGSGGLPVPHGLIHPFPTSSRDGTTPLIDTDLEQVMSALAAADGVKNIESAFGARTKAARIGAGAAQGIVLEGNTRAGLGGLQTPAGLIHTLPSMSRDGTTPYLDVDLGRVTTSLFGPTGARAMGTIETGAGRGFDSLDSGNVLVAASADFSRSYTGKHLGNMPDDATSDRRAATANQKTGGDRGAAAIDSGNVAVTTAVDLVRSYTNKHMGNMPDDATSDRHAATSNQKGGGDRAFSALDAAGIILAAFVDFARSYTGKHMGNIPDDATSDRRAVNLSQQTGAGRAASALDTNNRLVDCTNLLMVVAGGVCSNQTTSPLSSSSFVITVASHNLILGGTAVSMPSGSVTVAGVNTWYVYMDDPTFSGAGSYVATTQKGDLASAKGRYYVGQITTVSGGSGTGGHGGGGAIRPI